MKIPFNYWYPLLESHEVKTKPLGVERLGKNFVFWRTTDGEVHAQLDRCPHLGAALSLGKISDDHLVCPYHGYEFDRSGQCKYIPALGRNGKIPKKMSVNSFKVCEQHGFIWLWWGEDQEDYPQPPFFADLLPENEPAWRYGTKTMDWPVHYTRAIESQLDVAHLPYVHRATIGTDNESLVEGPYVEADKTGIKVWMTTAVDEGQAPRKMAELAEAAAGTEAGLRLLFPGIWLLTLGPRLKNFIAFVPINEQKTRYYIRCYHQKQHPVLARLFECLMGFSNRYIFGEDKRVAMTQTPANSLFAKHDILIAADRPVSRFRKLLATLIETPEGYGEPCKIDANGEPQ
ncbi:aromatic ring-hydroxylating dioxygenase subunit alpha [Methylosoma difficile]